MSCRIPRGEVAEITSDDEADWVPADRQPSPRAPLNTADGADTKAALERLGIAMTDATTAIELAGRTAPADAFRAVANTLLALASAPRLFAALRSVIAVGGFGPDIAREIAQHEARLAEFATATAAHRRELDDLLALEQRLRDAEREQVEVARQITTMRQLERVAGSLADLQAQRDALQNQTATVARAISDASAEIAAAGEQLAVLTGELMDVIGSDAREALRRAREQDRLLHARIAERRAAAERSAQSTERLRAQVSAAEAEASSAERELAQAQSELSVRLEDLRRHARADRDVLAALFGAQEAEASSETTEPNDTRKALDEAESRLADVDAALAQALKSRDGAPGTTQLGEEQR